ncbi:putative membrane protein [Advenella incenata]|uniref:Putative membrane protein n=1 Tax=Advenella incenata TaxID=267800 RepID=A0A4Q7V6C0_9BURK|nr:putative membrane protein [Advenella incenata]
MTKPSSAPDADVPQAGSANPQLSPTSATEPAPESVHQARQIALNPCYRVAAFVSLLLLFLLCIAWELFLDPLMPGGSVYVLKALPLLFPLYGVYKGNLYTLQWSSMLVLLYFTEGVVRWYSDISTTSSMLGAVETVLALVFFLAAILYVRPAKQAAKRAKKQGK